MNAERQVAAFASDRFLTAHPVFTMADLEEAGLQSWVRYRLRTGAIQQVERGVYAAVPPGTAARSFTPNPFLTAAVVRGDAVFGNHAALQLLGAAYSAYHTLTVFTSRRRRPLRVGRTRIEFLPHPVPLERRRATRLGVVELRYRGRVVAATGRERTLVDGFRRPGQVGGLEELMQSASGFPSLDFGLLTEILRAYDQRALWAAVGWFLERYRRTLRVPHGYLEDLDQHRPVSPHYLPRHHRGQGGYYVSRWNLVLPERVRAFRERVS
jgi:predicted transcriptional regulator of viral defense system